MKTDQKFDNAYKSWIIGCQKMVDDHVVAHAIANDHGSRYSHDRVLISERGKKYIKIVSEDNTGGRSAWGFVNMGSGDVLKAASWAAPAKHARGNIFDEFNGLARVGPYGPNYLK
jgi:hypothetical protein